MTGERPASALEQTLAREETRQMREVMAELDPQDVRYLEMWIQGLKYKEIMAVEQVSMDTVKSRLFRGRKILQNRLADYARQAGYRKEPADS